jgi:GTP:adenosylcobinamide-phosphate guanylyltransferase
MTAPGFSAIILAGQRPGGDPLAQHFGIEAKALIDVAGRPMLDWVARALLSRGDVGRVIVLAQDAPALLEHPGTRWMRADARVMTCEGGSSIVDGIIGALENLPPAWPVLLTTADNVLLDGAMIDVLLATVGDADVAASLVERRTLEAAYPGNRRTWLPFRGGAYSGANLFWLGTPAAMKALGVWRDIEQKRKRVRAVLNAFGPLLGLLIAVRILNLDQAIAWAGRRLGLKAKAVVLPIAEACIDVDKLSDHEMVEAIIAARGRGSQQL